MPPAGLNNSPLILSKLITEVQSCLRAIEERVGHGYYAAGYVSYEAAPAMDPLCRYVPTRICRSSGSLRSSDDSPDEPSGFIIHHDRQASTTSIAAVRDAISRGDTYQVNYSFRLRAEFAGDDYSFYRALQRAQPAPYSAYLNLGRYRVLSLSPELFFRRSGSTMTTRPMKGTTRRGRWLEEDSALAQLLRNQEEPRENNDDRGSAAERLRPNPLKPARFRCELFELERYQTLWQMTSTMKPSCAPAHPWATFLPRCFLPLGHGAPKGQHDETDHAPRRFTS